MPRPLPSRKKPAPSWRPSAPGRPGRPPPAAGRALTKTIKALDERFGKGVGGLKARWTEIVGAALARRTEPVKLVKPRGGGGAALELRVDGPSATLIQHQAPDILARVNLFLGVEAVTRLRIVQGPLSGFAGRQPPAARPSRRRATGPLDAAAEADLAQSLAALPEGRLKRALTRLGREVLRD